MTTEMTPGELTRAIHRLEGTTVPNAVYDRDLREIRADIREIKESNRWMTRLMVSNFIGLVVAVIVFLVTRGIG